MFCRARILTITAVHVNVHMHIRIFDVLHAKSKTGLPSALSNNDWVFQMVVIATISCDLKRVSISI